MRSLVLSVLCLLAVPLRSSAAELILNEYNGVAPGVWLNGGSEFVDDDGEAAADATVVDTFSGDVGEFVPLP